MTSTDTDIKQHYILTVTFTEPLLGHRKQSKNASHSYFYRDGDDHPILLDRHIMGFFKEAAQALNEVYDGLESALTRKVFIAPKEVLLELPEGEVITIIDRPPHLVKVEGRKVETVEATRKALENLRDLNLQSAVFGEKTELVAKLGINIYPNEDLSNIRLFCGLNIAVPQKVSCHKTSMASPKL